MAAPYGSVFISFLFLYFFYSNGVVLRDSTVRLDGAANLGTA